jgi:hypothetical protein
MARKLLMNWCLIGSAQFWGITLGRGARVPLAKLLRPTFEPPAPGPQAALARPDRHHRSLEIGLASTGVGLGDLGQGLAGSTPPASRRYSRHKRHTSNHFP